MTLVSPRRQVAAFLALLVLVRGPFYVAAVVGGWTNRNVPLGMVLWAVLSAPPALVVALRWAERRRLREALRGYGWRPGPVRYLLAGLAGPVAAALVVYGAAWATGLAVPAPAYASDSAAVRVGLIGAAAGRTLLGALSLVVPTLLFEELAWRGFLVPRLAEFLPFGRVALSSGAVWALFHYPFLLWPTAAAGTTAPPSLLGVGAFTAAVVAASFPLAWLRLRSGSVWPAVLFHAAHNALTLGPFARAVRPRGAAGEAFLGESGVGLALAYGALACWAWRHRAALPSPAPEAAAGRVAALQQRVWRRVWQRAKQRAREFRDVRLPDVQPRLTRPVGAGLLAVGLGHLAYGLVRRAAGPPAAEVPVAAYLVLAAGTALGAWLVGRGDRRPA